MAQVASVDPRSLFDRTQWRALTRVDGARGIALVAHCWGTILAIIALASWWANPVGYVLAVLLLGGRQLGLAILMHDAAHGLIHPRRAWNNRIGEWLCAAPVGTDLKAYRAYHLAHHRYTQQPEDPDLPLSAPFPVSRASLVRKALRDLSGLTFVKQRSAQAAMALGTLRGRTAPAQVFVAAAFLKFLAAQAVLLALSLLLWGWTPFLLWILALATSFQLYLRIRNIAEHACTRTGDDDPFSHARTTRANWIERATVAPYWVNFHAEHHLFMGVPCHRLRAAHDALGRAGLHDRMTIAPGYHSVIAQVSRG